MKCVIIYSIMKIYAAPMEGITGYIYRNLHAEYFGGCDRYYMPFVDPKDQASLMRKEKKDIAPENNTGIPVVPQILTNRPDRFTAVAKMLESLGYEEVNLNLGCPSGTVVSNGKGSGFLAEPDRLRRFFEEIFNRNAERGTGICVSVKTRLGMKEPDEIGPLMEIFNDYPVCEIIVHARVREDYYKKPVRPEGFREALAVSRHPVCCNGDLFDTESIENFQKAFPLADRIMIGRGLIADPGLPLKVNDPLKDQGESGLIRTRDFMRDLCSRYEAEIGNNALFKMKEIWTYMLPRFEVPKALRKKLMKSRRLTDYRIHAETVFREGWGIKS